MGEPPHSRPPQWRESWAGRIVTIRDVLWSWLTDPAVLVYRKHGFGHKRLRAVIVEFFLFVREVVREFWNIEGTARAASLAYTTLLSLIPLIVAFSFYFSKVFPELSGQIDTALNALIPYQSPQIAAQLARFRENAGAVTTVGVILFMFIAFRLFLAVEGAVNQIWKVRSSRGYRQKIIAFTMLFFWGPLLMGLSFTTTKMLEQNRYLRILFEGDFLFIVAPVVVLFVGFTMLFWLVPSARVRLVSAMVGAVVTTVMFSLVRWAFGLYSAHLMSGRFNFIYGTLGLALIFLVAIETMWVVILFGVEVSYVWQNLYGVLLEIARRFDRREEAPSTYRLAEQFGTTDSQMLRVLRKLEDAKLVSPVGGEWIGYVPACDPDRISVDEVMVQIEGVSRNVPDDGASDEERAVISELFTRVNTCTASALDHMSIGRLVRELYSPREVREGDSAAASDAGSQTGSQTGSHTGHTR